MSPIFRQALSTLDKLINEHGDKNPQLRQELEDLRAQLLDAERRKNASDVAKIALQLASWARWVIDLFS